VTVDVEGEGVEGSVKDGGRVMSSSGWRIEEDG